MKQRQHRIACCQSRLNFVLPNLSWFYVLMGYEGRNAEVTQLSFDLTSEQPMLPQMRNEEAEMTVFPKGRYSVRRQRQFKLATQMRA